MKSKDATYNNLLEKAINLACHAHRGQLDKAGQPYILHPLRVMMRFNSMEEMITAVLHDVVEDSAISLDDLRRDGFPEHIIEAVDCISQREGEKYDNFIERTKQNPLALKVKLADLEDNLDAKRLVNLKFRDWARFNKYLEVWHKLRDDGG